jgi:uridine phosphorylase
LSRQYHIECDVGDVAPYVLLPGDPHRVPLVAALWDESHKVAENREHATYTGTYKGMPITCTSTGMGCPSTAIAIEELARCGAKTFLRMGTCAGIASYVNPGDITIFDSACRFEGTTKQYVPVEYPAVAHHEIVEAAIHTVKRMDIPYHVGTSRCVDALYANRPDANTSYNGFHQHNWDYFLDDLAKANVIAGDMESSAVMVLSRLFGLRGGALCVCVTSLTAEYAKGGELDLSKVSYHGDKISLLTRVAVNVMYQIYQNDQKNN